MTQAFIDSLAIKIAIFAVFLCMVAVALRRIRWCGEIAPLSSIQPATCHMHESGSFYAKLPFITIIEGADPSPLLRSILTDDIRCGAITEYLSPAFEKLKAEMVRQTRFQIRAVRLEVGGMCERCQKAQK